MIKAQGNKFSTHHIYVIVKKYRYLKYNPVGILRLDLYDNIL